MPAPVFECFLCGGLKPVTEMKELEFVTMGPVGRNLLPSSSFNPQFWQVTGGTLSKDQQGAYPAKRRRKLLETNAFRTISPIYSMESGHTCWTDVEVADPGEWVLNGDVGPVSGVGNFDVAVTVGPPAPPTVFVRLANVGGSRGFQLSFAVATIPVTVRVEITGYVPGGRWWFDCLQLRRPQDEFVYTVAGALFFPKAKEIRAKVPACSECYDEEIGH